MHVVLLILGCTNVNIHGLSATSCTGQTLIYWLMMVMGHREVAGP